MRGRQAEVHRVDLDAGGQLGFLDRLLDRLDRGLEIDDDAALDAARVGQAHADDVQPAIVGRLADDRRDLRRAHIQTDEVSFPACHVSPSESLASRWQLHRRAVGTASRLHVDALLEAKIHVVDVRDTLAERLGDLQVRLEPLAKAILAEVQQRRIVVEQDDGIVRVGDVDLRHAASSQLRLPLNRVDHPRGQFGARAVDAAASDVADRERDMRWTPRAAVGGKRPSTIGRSNSAYCGPNSSITVPSRDTR